ncbi:hypothetical protein EST38_g11362 [Candolleomyces aberdarensis]|uniref:Uncharacterized protein n=1 Tax=Candolleomyces aberdarensis TaxID=2316362 RepID=A0A4Q2D7S7_9AGAR|nr:hypothetical protein EST38_g11362 [Candolleomyces aberdarensis]
MTPTPESERIILVQKNGGWTEEFDVNKSFDAFAIGDLEEQLAGDLAYIVMDKLVSPVTSQAIDSLTAEIASRMEFKYLAYGRAAASIESDLMYRETEYTFSEAMEKAASLLSDEFYELVARNKSVLDHMIVNSRDELLD